MPRAVRTWSIRLLALAGCALTLAACSGGPSSPSASSTTSTSSSGTTSTTSGTSGTLVPQTSSSTEFFSPSKNISCEIDNGASSAMTGAFCLTMSPPKSVQLKSDSTLTECTGVSCLGNAGENTPTLAYGQSISLGPFTCASSTAGITCTLANGDGFLISSSATTALGSATIATGTGSG
jgi:hypothetical protein